MVEESRHSHISAIATSWSLLERAHRVGTPEASQAQLALILRYQVAIHRYLIACLGSDDVAGEVFQEFTVKLLRGDFRGADPGKGRFRDYLKTSLVRMVIDQQRKSARQARPASAEVLEYSSPKEAEPAADDFDENWRSALLERVWDLLAAEQRAGGPAYCAVLQQRCDHPDATAAQIAEALNSELKPQSPYREAGIRKLLQRSREKFGELLLDEIADLIGSRDLDAIEEELIALRLLSFCQTAVARRREDRHS